METAFLLYVFISTFVSYTNAQQTYICSDDWDNSVCRQHTITCDSHWNPCSMICLGEGSCDGSILNCTQGVDCIIECRGFMSCRGTVTKSQINCPNDNQCTIICNERSCESMEINCPLNGDCIINATDIDSLTGSTINCPDTGNCIINALGTGSLSATKITCPSDGECILKCHGKLACNFATVDGRYASNLDINCKNQSQGCQNMHIFCPIINGTQDTKICSLSGNLIMIMFLYYVPFCFQLYNQFN